MANTNTPLYSNVSVTGNGNGLTYSSGTNAGAWATTISEAYYNKKPKVQITDSDIELDGLSLRETMLAIKNELMIPTCINRNVELEQEFAELRAHADRYYELEQKFLEQKKMWETLKK